MVKPVQIVLFVPANNKKSLDVVIILKNRFCFFEKKLHLREIKKFIK